MKNRTFWISICVFLFCNGLIAQNNLDSLLNVLKQAKPDTQKVNLYNILSNEFLNINPDSSLLFAKQAYTLSNKLNFNEGKSVSLIFTSHYYNYKALSDSSLILLKQAERYTENEKTLSRIYNAFGSTYDSRGEIKLAIEYYNKSLKIAKKTSNQRAIGSVLSNIGFVLQNQGNYAESLDYFLQSLDIFKKLGDEMSSANLYNLIGNTFYHQKKFKKALQNYFKSLDIYKRNKYDLGLSYTYGNISGCYLNDKNFSKALKASYLALKLIEKNGSPQDIAQLYVEIGGIYFEQNKLNKAFEKLNLALKLSQSSKNKNIEMICLNKIGYYYERIKNNKTAYEYFNKSLILAKELSSLEDLKNNYSSISRLDVMNGDYKSAFSNYKLFILYKDSINNIDGIKKQYELEARYDYDIKLAQDSIAHNKAQELKNAEIEKQTLQLKSKRNQQIVLFGGLFVVILFASFMYNRFKVTQKQKMIIERKEFLTQKQNEIIIEQKHIVEEKQKEIVDSIQYARRIQNTILASEDFLSNNIPPHFIYFSPKDIVSGDFYWAIKKNNYVYLAVCDSTGHGVPGAFMSLLNTNFLNEAIVEKNITEPNQVFNYVRERLSNTISKEGQRDGFDGILVQFDSNNPSTINYVAANNAPILIRENEIIELPKDKMPVGKGEKEQSFTLQTIQIQEADSLFLYTDGYADQFGGLKGKKYKYKPLNDLLLRMQNKSLNEQFHILENTFNDWKGNLEQVDDVCVIGIRF